MEKIQHYLILGTYYEDTKQGPMLMLREVPADWKTNPPVVPTNDISSEKVKWYDAKRIKKYIYGTPGAVFAIETEDRTISLHTAKHDGRWPDTEVSRDLQAAETMRERTYLARKSDKKDAAREELEEALEPIRELYRRAIGRNRVQLLARIVAFITS